MQAAPLASCGKTTVIEPQISLKKYYFSFHLTVEKQIKHDIFDPSAQTAIWTHGSM